MHLLGILKRKERTPPWPAYPAWSTSKFWSFLRSALRSAHTRWPPAREALEKAGRPYKGPNKRQKKEYLCSVCGHYYVQAKVEKDHIVPCGSLKSYEDLPGFVERLFVPTTGYRILCKPCHKIITKEARANKDVSMDN